MKYSFLEIELEKEEFKKYIIVLNHFITWGSHEFYEKHLRIVHIITSIIAKYHNYDDWFFKKFLIYCLREKKFIFYIYNNNKNINSTYFKIEFSNIIHILRKCYTSKILEFIVKKVSVPPIKANSRKDWYNKNRFFNRNYFKFIYEFILQISNDIKIPNKNNKCITETEQLLHIIVSHYRSSIKFYLKEDKLFYYD